VQVVVRRFDSTDITAKGKILYGLAHFGAATGADTSGRREVEAAVQARIQALPNLFVTAIDAVRAGSGWNVRAEVVGPRVPTPEEIRGVERHVGASLGATVALSLRARVDLVVTGTHYEALGQEHAADVHGAAGGNAAPARPPGP
jgi:hypothetical protein